jgi:hypothetical protein
VDRLSPEYLDQYLAILKKHGVQSAKIAFPEWSSSAPATEIAVVFDVMPVPVGEVPERGGWKSPERLDQPMDSEVP